jgi:hypothetical protein
METSVHIDFQTLDSSEPLRGSMLKQNFPNQKLTMSSVSVLDEMLNGSLDAAPDTRFHRNSI